MTEQTPSDLVTDAEKFRQVSTNLTTLAVELCKQHPSFPPHDVGKAFLCVAVWLLGGAIGERESASYLRQLADLMDATRQ